MPPIYAEADVVVDASATIGPNVVLGRGCSVGASATVRESVLWERVSVGAGATIEEAIVASGVTIGANARIARGSVIGHDVTVEPGTVLEPGHTPRLAARKDAPRLAREHSVYPASGPG